VDQQVAGRHLQTSLSVITPTDEVVSALAEGLELVNLGVVVVTNRVVHQHVPAEITVGTVSAHTAAFARAVKAVLRFLEQDVIENWSRINSGRHRHRINAAFCPDSHLGYFITTKAA